MTLKIIICDKYETWQTQELPRTQRNFSTPSKYVTELMHVSPAHLPAPHEPRS